VGARLARERALQSTTKPGASTHTGSPPKRNPGKAVRNTGGFRCEPTIALKVTKPSGAIMAVCSVPIPPGLIASKNDTLLAIPANPSLGPCPGARPESILPAVREAIDKQLLLTLAVFKEDDDVIRTSASDGPPGYHSEHLLSAENPLLIHLVRSPSPLAQPAQQIIFEIGFIDHVTDF
jgi:hypothetical protein